MPRGVLAATVLVLVLAASGAGYFVHRGRADRDRPMTPSASAANAATSAASAASSADPTWCGKPLGSRAVGRLTDRSACSKISLTGTAPTCFFWADCGELHFEIDCASGGPDRCRCDGEEGTTVSYRPSFCALDSTDPKGSLRAILDSASTACRWAPR
jgi:hypothetical protein